MSPCWWHRDLLAYGLQLFEYVYDAVCRFVVKQDFVFDRSLSGNGEPVFLGLANIPEYLYGFMMPYRRFRFVPILVLYRRHHICSPCGSQMSVWFHDAMCRCHFVPILTVYRRHGICANTNACMVYYTMGNGKIQDAIKNLLQKSLQEVLKTSDFVETYLLMIIRFRAM